ncbi:MAG: S41 family peptidase [Bacteroidota bacterium]
MQQKNNTIHKVYLWLPAMLSIMLVAGILIGLRLNGASTSALPDTAYVAVDAPNQGKIEQLLRFIESKYVDEVDREKLVDEAIESILKQLDPHSAYISKEEMRSVTEDLDGNFEGIGVEFMILEDTVVVVSAISGGPAAKVGIRAGDKIVQVEDSTVAGVGMTNTGIISLLKGDKGTEVEVGIFRPGIEGIQKFKLTRDEIPIYSVDASYMIGETTGYIRINRFRATTDREFIDALEKLETSGMDDLVLDLRQNPGGYLQKAANMLNQLFDEKGNLMVYTQGRSVNRSNYKTSGRGIFNIDKIAVLINEGSASASEIVAGAIQDHDRGIIVGRRSFGKGLVQDQYQLKDGSALRLTIARYYTPSGRSIQKSYEDLDAYQNDFNERFESGELLSENNISIADSTRYFTDNGRVVFGGGGITPDVFVPIDTSVLDPTFTKLNQYVANYSFNYYEQNRSKLSDLSIEEFVGSYQITDATYNSFVAYSLDHSSQLTMGAISDLDAKLQNRLKENIKARVGKQLFADEGYYRVINSTDPMIISALDALKDYKNILRRKQFRD